MAKRSFATTTVGNDFGIDDCGRTGFDTWEEAQRDSLGFIIEDSCYEVEGFDAEKVKFEDGVVTYVTPGGEKVVLAHMASTLEWTLPSPPPRHCFEESPIIYDIE
eukprot:CAMPEP_0170177198 /NCGR_PEP_ID=MMETSP0040_2-20121228/9897_1 /TAXON_ID=641309 /ORGANISM="Lotharella oceanica, Strain CCMP622" /LENGTH=104 /DNA_ID=CAMNT_0010419759 /DNA_START=104 /DNA_END=418 /DNA_ORIENTATION=+